MFGFRFTDAQFDFAGVVIGLRNDAGLHLLDDSHHIIHQRVGERVGDDFLHLAGFYLRVGDGISSGFTVGDNQTGCTEIHTTIVAHHDDEDIREFVAVDLSEDGFTSSAGGLAVVVGSELQSFRAEHVGIAHVAGIEVFLAIAGKDVLDFLN